MNDTVTYTWKDYNEWRQKNLKLQADLAAEERASKELKKGLDIAVAVIKQLELRPKDQSCVPCASIDGNCCGVLFWVNEDVFRCNECGRKFNIEVKS